MKKFIARLVMQYLHYADIQALKTYVEGWVQENNNVHLCIVLKDGGNISITLSLLSHSCLLESTLRAKFLQNTKVEPNG